MEENKKPNSVERKNFSFYAPTDLSEKIKKVQARDEKLKALSMSQAIYYIVSQLADGADLSELSSKSK